MADDGPSSCLRTVLSDIVNMGNLKRSVAKLCLAWTADDTQKSITGGAELAPAIEDVNSAIGTATQITDDIRSEYVERLNAQASTMVAEDGDPAAQIDHAVAQVLKPY